MTPPAEVVEWLANRYPKPRIDADWLQGCYNWLVDEEKLSPALNLSAFMEGFEYQLLASDLSDSMQNNTGLQLDVRRPVTTLRGPPVLVQIVSITDIGMPAARLDQIRVAREEWKGSNVDTAEDKGDGYAPGIPSYPRGTLYLKLSDGTTTINAMEYRPLPQLTMGNTELGYKANINPSRHLP
ncbi:hypothetical protein HYPSUDRAFT_147233 [Hypholoma sublateritium FD-334 SS-4]|uniref:RecQ-mediated genome instability protein 1 n=1 Tax=Hypholoma sublateritium (strain FD-334 SS-4) TaxID=945553 RepID=A0A0D2P8Y8_HYPSF|nr:hypothetical protein HYPSUDRAFT_147233 [Hypholoma sublateritium FD-334 SS-4]